MPEKPLSDRGKAVHVTLVDSKQIMYVVYDEQKLQMIVHYHSGDIHVFSFISKKEFQALVNDINGYDQLVKITHERKHNSMQMK